MTHRSVAAIIVCLVVFIEILIFASQPTPKKFTPGESGSFFSSDSKIETDYNATSNRNVMFGIIIGSTVAVGGIVIFSIPNNQKRKNNDDKGA